MPKQRAAKTKPVPEFRNEREEREFWETHDTTDYVDWSTARIVRFANLKPSTTTISLRLPSPLLADLKALANKRDVPYQSLLKVFLAERVAAEQRLPGTLPAKRTVARPSRARRTSGGGRAAVER